MLNCLITATGQPFAAQLADTTSRPTAYAISLTLYVIGFIVVASANGVSAIAAGEHPLRSNSSLCSEI